MRLEDFDYELPRELIAQYPAERRDACRLLVLDRKTGKVSHRRFYDVPEYLREGDCLVLNDSRVIPARLFGVKRGTGAGSEFLLIKRRQGDVWETMVRPGRKIQKGDEILFGIDTDRYASLCDPRGTGRETAEMEDMERRAPLKALITGYGEEGTRLAEFEYQGAFHEVLDRLGKIPLPPYIERESGEKDREYYQTVYSRCEGSVAAPTAGLHFTEELLERVKEKGVRTAELTLHVGIGTFRPVREENIEDHHMHFEEYHVSDEAAETVNGTIRSGKRVICVGTTSVRTLESVAVPGKDGRYYIRAGSGETGIFIYPGYEFKIADSLITNFHLPRSTLLMLVSAMYDREAMLEVYKEAVRQRYSFFSYGDAMLII